MQWLLIGDIRDTSNAVGCYCSFYPFLADSEIVRNRYIFNSDADGKAWMNINEQGVEFVVTEQCSAGSQVGVPADRQCEEHATYIGAGMNVQVDLVETWHCLPEIEECEVTDFDASITVEKEGFQESVKVKGACGC